MDADDALSIDERVRKIRSRHGLSLEVVGGLAGISGPYLAVDRQSAEVAAAVTEISKALQDTTLDDVPDVPAWPLCQLTDAAQ